MSESTNLAAGRSGIHRWAWLSGILGVAAVVLLGVVVVRVIGAASGAGSPEEAVEDFIEGIAAEDPVATVEAVHPAELRGADAFFEALEQRLDQIGAETDDLGGEGLVYTVRDLELATDPVADRVAVVEVTGGEIVVRREDGEPLDPSIVAFLRADGYADDLGESEGSTELEEIEPTDEVVIDVSDLWRTVASPFLGYGHGYGDDSDGTDADDLATRFVALEGDDGWHVSLFGTVADAWAQFEGEDPDYGAVDAVLDSGADDRTVGESPEAAITAVIESYNGGALTEVLDALPAGMVASLYAFAPQWQDLLDDESVATDVRVGAIATSAVDEDDDWVRVRVDQLSVEGTVSDSQGEEDASFSLDGECATFDGVEDCLDEEFVASTGIDGLILTLAKVDGGYQLDPVATLFDNLTTFITTVDDAELAEFFGDTTYGERTAVNVGATSVELDHGRALLEIDAEAGEILSVQADADVDLEFFAPDSQESDWDSTAVFGDGAATPTVGAYAVQTSGTQLVRVDAREADLATVAVTMNLGDVPTVGLDAEVELQYDTYGVALLDPQTSDEAGWYALVVEGPGAQSSCWGDDGCVDLIVAAGGGVSLTEDRFADFPEEDYRYRSDESYALSPRAEADFAGGDAGDGWLDLDVVDGAASGELVVTGAGWVLLDATNLVVEADIALEVSDESGAVVCASDVNGEYGDEWCDVELEPGTYQVTVQAPGITSEENGVGLYLN